nr:ProQ/FinO family protein [uncultured Cupriavidus sp.]
MGFEQLAALKAKMAEQAKSASQAKKPRPRPAPAAKRAAPATPATPSTPVDPVVRNIGKLQKRFPQAFPKNPAPKLPLKIGIFEDLLAHAKDLALTEDELRSAIRTWCRGARYWACLTIGNKRVDLAGQEAGLVTEADARRAHQLRAARPKAKPAAPKDAPAPAPDGQTADNPEK